MKFTLQTTDDLHDHYREQAEEMQRRGQATTAEELMADRLDRFKAVTPGDRIIVIDPKSRQRLETILSGGSLLSAEDLVSKIERLSGLAIGEIRLDFTTAETRQISNWARRQGRQPESVLKDIVDKIKLNIFDHVPDVG